MFKHTFLFIVVLFLTFAAFLVVPVGAQAATLHFASNTKNAESTVAGLGYNIVDITGLKNNPSSLNNTINALPAGVKALVWLGNLDNSNCTTPGYTTAQFQAQVDALAANSRVFGYYISDEPHPATCTTAAADIAARADYVHAHAPGQIAFITVQDGSGPCPGGLGCEYGPLNPTNSHVDLIGVDPYPCHYDSQGNSVPCDNTMITSRVNAAIASGIPQSAIVPVFQEFGQEGRTDGKQVFYRTPSVSELQTMLTTWAGLVPNPVFDFSYTWGVQCTTSCPAPQALSNHTELQAVAQAHNKDALHFAANTSGGESTLAGLGFNLIDVTASQTNPSGVKTTIDALPSGTQALVWVGNLDNSNCSNPGFTTAQFQAQVDALVGDAKVFGYYLADDPHPATCPTAAADVKARADYIHAHAPGQVAFITVTDGTSNCGGTLGCEYNALKPANTDVDYIGVHPYPCHYDGSGNPVACDNTQITDRVNAAVNNGVPATAIVPVFQEFGQEGRTDGGSVYYRTPSASELQTMLNTWAGAVSYPVFDYVYTWGVQCGTSCSAPQALSNHSELQTVAQSHNAL